MREKLSIGDCRVTDVALDSGFDSVDGYTRAFFREFGQKPDKYTRKPVPIPLFIPCGAKFREFRKWDDDNPRIQLIIFSEEQYHKMYKDAYNWSNLKQVDMLREKTGLFIGCSLSDSNMRRLLDIVAYKENETKRG